MKNKQSNKIVNCGKKSYGLIFLVLFLSIIMSFGTLHLTYLMGMSMDDGAHCYSEDQNLILQQIGPYKTKLISFGYIQWFSEYDGMRFNIKQIDGGAALNNHFLQNVKIYNLERVGRKAFAYCSELEELDLQSEVIEEYVIEGSNKLNTIHIETPRIISHTFANAPMLSTVYLYNVHAIEEEAFYNCPNLRRIVVFGSETKMPNSLTGDEELDNFIRITYEGI